MSFQRRKFNNEGANRKRMRQSMKLLHLSRTQQQFNTMGELVLADWCHWGEQESANWLRDTNLCCPWNRWYVAASGIPGVMPTSNPIEAYNRQIKQQRLVALRASTQFLLTYGLPTLVTLDTHILGNNNFIYTQKYPAFPSRVYVAHKMLNMDYLQVSSDDGMEVNTYFNAGWWYFQNGRNARKLCVSEERVEKYEAGLRGERGNCRKLGSYKCMFLSLSKVTCMNNDYENARCDCKYFWRGGCCQHILLCRHLDWNDDYSLQDESQPLQATRRRGRPKRTAPALMRQEEIDNRPSQKRRVHGRGRGQRGRQGWATEEGKNKFGVLL